MSEPFAQYPYGQYPAPEPPKRHRGRTMLGLTATAIVAAGAGAGAAVGLSHGSTTGGSATSTSTTMLSTAQIAKSVDPGIVDVTSTLGYQNATAKGTGIVLTSNGEILTNNHVINGATAVSVTDIGNGKTYKATVVGYDESHDIAVLQLSGASGLTTATTGDSSTVKVGDGVVALGNAGGVGGTPSVAPGAVTALNQSITASDEGSGTSEQLTGLIETNADIQAGDSGGPLANSHGQVIAIDTAASTNYQFGGSGNGGFGNGGGIGGFGSGSSGSSGSGSSGSSGSSSSAGTTQGFAIPINTALSIAKSIEAGQGSSTVHIGATAFLGLEIDTQGSSGQGFGQGSSSGQGVQIGGTQAGTPAAEAGIGQGDLVTGLDGKTVSTGTDITQILVGHHPGDKVGITWTDAEGQSHTATLTLGTGPAA
jgi:S1-C subfamily serine protease